MTQFARKFLCVLVCVAIFSSGGVLKTSASSATLPEANTIRVATTGADAAGCGSEAQPCQSIQYAVNQAVSGDVILVAKGTYTYNSSNDPCGFTITHSVVCWTDKQLTINGGYTTANWSTADPVNNLTIIDGGSAYRGVAVIRLNGVASLNMQGFTVQNGRAAGAPVGYQYDGNAFGAGMWASRSFVNLKNMVFKNNVATGGSSQSFPVAGWGFGGGLALEAPTSGGNSTLEKVTFTGNQAIGGTGSNGGGNGMGGGLFSATAVTAQELTFTNNLAKGGNNGGSGCSNPGSGYGGAASLNNDASLSFSYITATGNQAIGSNASGANSCPGNGNGGGFFMENATVSISDSLFQSNQAIGGAAPTGGIAMGGGLYSDKTNLTLDRVKLIGNSATSGSSTSGGKAGQAGGGGAYMTEWDGKPYHTTVLNCLFAENAVLMGTPGSNNGGGGAGMFIMGTAVDVTHSTFVNNKCDNGLCDGQGLLAIKSSLAASATIKYSVFTDHRNSKTDYNYALQVNSDAGNTANLAYVWLGNNTNDLKVPAGTPQNHVVDDSRSAGYISPSSPDYNYHLRSDAPVMNLGTGSTTSVDLDNLSRPVGGAADLGAYEYRFPSLVANQPNLYLMTDTPDILSLNNLISVDTGPVADWTATTASNWVYLGPSGTSQQTTGRTGTNLTIRFDPSKIGKGNHVVTISLTSSTANATTITIYFYYVAHVNKAYLPGLAK